MSAAAQVLQIHGQLIVADADGAPVMPGHWHIGMTEWQDAWCCWWGYENLDPATLANCVAARVRDRDRFQARVRALGEIAAASRPAG
jgi:hypothetical protein